MAETHLLHRPDTGQISVNDPLLRRILPGQPLHSSVLQRALGTFGFNRMPPLASSQIDNAGLAMLADWINLSANVAPTFGPPPATVRMHAAVPGGTVVGTFAATDPDAPRDTVSYSIGSGSAPSFAVNPATGQVTTVGALQANASYTVNLIAADSLAANPLASALALTIAADKTNQQVVLAPLNAAFPGSSDPAVIGFNADPNRNGLPNAFDLLFGINPATGHGQPVIRLFELEQGGQTHAAFEIEVNSTMSDELFFHVQIASDFQSWQDAPNPPAVVLDIGGVRTLRIVDPEPKSAHPRRFFRVRIEPTE